MKRFLSCVFTFVLSLAFLMPVLSHAKNTSFGANAPTLEESISKNKKVIVNTEKNSLSGQLLVQCVENETPFDSENEALKSGVIIQPTINSYGEVNSSYAVPSFSVDDSKSIYMWIFIPDENLYDIELTFSSTLNGSISWLISNSRLSNMISKSSTLFGWKQFEFKVGDATKNTTIDLEEVSFTQLRIKYIDSLSLEYRYSNNKFAFYDVYVADSYLEQTGIVTESKYVNFKINTEFFYKVSNVFVGDSITISNSRSIFEYIYAGRQNLKNYPSNTYTFKFTFKNTASNNAEDVEFEKEYVFEKKGFFAINVQIDEYRTDESINILNYSHTGYCDEFGSGAFSDVNYELKYGEVRSIYFDFSDLLVIDGDVKVTSSNENIVEIQSYEVKNGKCYIQIKAKDDGKVKLSVTLNGHREGTTETLKYTKSTNVTVKEKDNFYIYLIITWIAFGVYFVVIVTFIIISFVKARKFSVK